MTKPDEPRPGQELPLEPSQLDEAWQVVEEYIETLRAIIKKLRRKMN
ncbi:hypothetical protein [Bradyrhizobium sp. Arg816]|nr:hypothetical protein [Bradyrhizobium sp. Arg816]MDI3566826.1 hypothetical protein [Bradyrhizobium sp. Arg816]